MGVNVTHYTTPLRYPGGKRKLANFVKLIFKKNELLDGYYVEPYAGGASIAFDLLFSEYVSEIYLNDIDPALYAFWNSILTNTEQICRLINDIPVTVDQWTKQKKVYKNHKGHSETELGFSFFYLNRTNRSGIIKGGIIGGKEQKGKWKIDARYNKAELIQRVKKIARYKNRINIFNIDAADFINNVIKKFKSKTLIYFDPPYYLKGPNLYENFYKHEDHAEISDLIKDKVRVDWIVSYDFTPEIQQFYSEYRNIVYNISYSAANRYKGAEIMYFSNGLSMPNIENPTKTKL